jgi:3-methyl-2-oxobutanoate hydroxymethyltransferase|tara:strand:+ start:1269 stop:2081 length:813 start_codon:yes stop_codon:yes gene_type:complete
MNPDTWTVPRIRALKGKQRFACLTAYDYPTARMVDRSGVPLILVGDSLGANVLGFESSLPVTMEHMLHHAAAVVRGVEQAVVVADMPYMSFQVSVSRAVENAGRFIQAAGVDAVKLEGGQVRVPTIAALVDNGIPVLSHIGLTPQSIREMGGYRVQGRSAESADQLIADACAVADAGSFAVVLECVPPQLGEKITESISVPTIGIGAGPACDAQILVLSDLLGLTEGHVPKFARQYATLAVDIQNAVQSYVADVVSGAFPAPEHTYSPDA